MCKEHHSKIHAALLNLIGETCKPFDQTITDFSEWQNNLIKNCITDLILNIRTIMGSDNKTLSEKITLLVNFINSRLELDMVLSPKASADFSKKLYPTIKSRLIIRIYEMFENFFTEFASHSELLENTAGYEESCTRIDNLIQFLIINKDKRKVFKKAFEDNLELHEKSALLNGFLIDSQFELENIIRVYSHALYNNSSPTVDPLIVLFTLWKKLLDNMSLVVSSVSSNGVSDTSLSLSLSPLSEMIVYTSGTLGIVETQIQYGLTVTHRTSTPVPCPFSPPLKPLSTSKFSLNLSTSLGPALLASFDAYAKQVHEDAKNCYINLQRKQEKYSSMENVVSNSKSNNLTPNVFYSAHAGKKTVFAAWGTSKTWNLFYQGKQELKKQIWDNNSTVKRSSGDPFTGFYIRDESLRTKLQEKYKSFLSSSASNTTSTSNSSSVKADYPDNNDLNIRNGLPSDDQKQFDKRKSLEFLVKADDDGNLHPSQFVYIATHFPRRKECFWLRRSAVGKIIEAVEEDLSESMWISAGGEGATLKNQVEQEFETKRAKSISKI